mgnify:CR=1 FL=1
MKASPSVWTGRVLSGLSIWGGLWLRDASLRAAFPVRSV